MFSLLGFYNQVWNAFDRNKESTKTFYEIIYKLQNYKFKFTRKALQETLVYDTLIKKMLIEKGGLRGILLAMNMNITSLMSILIKRDYMRPKRNIVRIVLSNDNIPSNNDNANASIPSRASTSYNQNNNNNSNNNNNDESITETNFEDTDAKQAELPIPESNPNYNTVPSRSESVINRKKRYNNIPKSLDNKPEPLLNDNVNDDDFKSDSQNNDDDDAKCVTISTHSHKRHKNSHVGQDYVSMDENDSKSDYNNQNGTCKDKMIRKLNDLKERVIHYRKQPVLQPHKLMKYYKLKEEANALANKSLGTICNEQKTNNGIDLKISKLQKTHTIFLIEQIETFLHTHGSLIIALILGIMAIINFIIYAMGDDNRDNRLWPFILCWLVWCVFFMINYIKDGDAKCCEFFHRKFFKDNMVIIVVLVCILTYIPIFLVYILVWKDDLFDSKAVDAIFVTTNIIIPTVIAGFMILLFILMHISWILKLILFVIGYVIINIYVYIYVLITDNL